MALHLPRIVMLLALMAAPIAASAGDLAIDLAPDPKNPLTPQMGDRLLFHSVVHNGGPKPVNGVIAWLTLLQIDRGGEQPIDLEDWSAQKAATAETLKPGETLAAAWPLRLIQAGTYRVIVTVVARDSGVLATSPPIDFGVRQKPVVESERVLPVAIGIPLLIGVVMLWRRMGRFGPRITSEPDEA